MTAQKIHQRVVADFMRAEEHAQSFESIRPIYDFNASWNFDEYRSQHHDITQLKGMLEHVTSWSKELEKLRNRPIGVLEVDSKRLKNELVPLREARLKEIKEYVKDQAREKCSKLLEHYKDCLAKLTMKPSHLKEFASHLYQVATLKEDEKILFKSTSQVDRMYNLLQQYDVTVPSEHLVSHEYLHDRQAEYRKEIELAQQFKENKLNEMIIALEINITKLQDQISVVTLKFEDSIYTELDHINDPQKVLDDLNLLGVRLEAVNSLAKTYSGYQKMFGVSVFDQSDLEKSNDKYETIQKMWNTVKIWSEKQEIWRESQLTDLQVDDIAKEVDLMFKDCYSLTKKLGSRASEKLRDQISEFKSMVPQVLDLGNPKMRTRHVKFIFLICNLFQSTCMLFDIISSYSILVHLMLLIFIKYTCPHIFFCLLEAFLCFILLSSLFFMLILSIYLYIYLSSFLLSFSILHGYLPYLSTFLLSFPLPIPFPFLSILSSVSFPLSFPPSTLLLPFLPPLYASFLLPFSLFFSSYAALVNTTLKPFQHTSLLSFSYSFLSQQTF